MIIPTHNMCGNVICYYKQITSVAYTDIRMEIIIHISKQKVYTYTFSYIIQTTSIKRYTVDYKTRTDKSIQCTYSKWTKTKSNRVYLYGPIHVAIIHLYIVYCCMYAVIHCCTDALMPGSIDALVHYCRDAQMHYVLMH